MSTAALALPSGLSVASAPCEPLICQSPKSSVGLMAFGLPPDSAMAISAAITASPDEPPACSHSASRPLQLYVPADVRVAPPETCETVAGALTAPEPLPLPVPLLWATGAA